MKKDSIINHNVNKSIPKLNYVSVDVTTKETKSTNKRNSASKYFYTFIERNKMKAIKISQ